MTSCYLHNFTQNSSVINEVMLSRCPREVPWDVSFVLTMKLVSVALVTRNFKFIGSEFSCTSGSFTSFNLLLYLPLYLGLSKV